jgi:chromosome segregation ATPase
MEAIDQLVRGIMALYEALKNIPGIGAMLDGLEEMAKKLNANFDSGIDGFSKLSDETIGATAELAKYTDELANLEDQYKKGEVTQEQYAKKREEILARQAEAVRSNAEKELAIEQDKMNKMIEAREAQLDRDKQLMDRKIEKINAAKDAEISAIDQSIQALEGQKNAINQVYDQKIEAVRRAAEEEKRAIDDSIAALNRQKTKVQDYYKDQLANVKSYYAKLKSEMDDAHNKEMAQMDRKIARLREAQGAAMDNLSSGPENEELKLMKVRQLT